MLTHDYVELFNRSDRGVDLGGLSIQYASATGTGALGANATQLTELPLVTLQPGQYFLVQQAPGSGGTVALDADHIDPTPIHMSGTSGKVALVTGVDGLGCNGGSTPCGVEQEARIVDLVGYGAADYFEGRGPTPGLSNSTAATRAGAGCTDTSENAADIAAVVPAPRNAGTASEPCDDAGGGDPDPDPVDPGDCGDDATLISAVQGAGPASPLVGQEVTIEGVVVGDFQGDPARPGYKEELGASSCRRSRPTRTATWPPPTNGQAPTTTTRAGCWSTTAARATTASPSRTWAPTAPRALPTQPVPLLGPRSGHRRPRPRRGCCTSPARADGRPGRDRAPATCR